MPKQTFFNLEETKRQQILNAARKEFTDHSLHKARVSNIIRYADIPRGSFYQYFEDLNDIYFYVIDLFLNNVLEGGRKFASKTNDLFEFAKLTFEYDYKRYVNDQRHRFMMNMMKSISDNDQYISIFQEKRTSYIKSILEMMDLSSIRFETEEERIRMYQLIQDVKRKVIQKSLIEELSILEAKQGFSWYIDVLKNGLLKGDQ